MTTEKAPSKEASLEGQAIVAYPDADIRCRRIWQGGKYAAVGPIGHLQPPMQTMALCGRMTCGSEYATSDALRLCRNCVEKAVRPTQRKSEIRADRDALRERNRALVEAARTVADKYDIFSAEWFIDIAKDKAARPATKHARLELSDAVDAMLAALAADAKAGEPTGYVSDCPATTYGHCDAYREPGGKCCRCGAKGGEDAGGE